MTALRGCPGCARYMRWGAITCNECDGTNSRRSYTERTANLAACLVAAAIEEMRFMRFMRTMQRMEQLI